MRLVAPLLAALAAAVVLSGDGLGAARPPALTEVVVTLKGSPPDAVRSTLAARTDAAARRHAERVVLAAAPGATIGWRYHLVANGFSVVLPQFDVARLEHLRGLEVWPSVSYHTLVDQGPASIGANQLWGPSLANAGQGIKIGILDDGVDANHVYFDATGFTYPPGFPKGDKRYTTPKVIVARAFAPPRSSSRYASVPFDPSQSFHATHVAGIAAGDHGTQDGALSLSGVAPGAYIGNYKVLTTPTPEFGLDGNSAEIVAGIEAAVADGMNVINLSLGEPEIEPSRDIVVHALDAAAAAGVVPVVAAGNDGGDYGLGSISSPANAPGAIAVAATTTDDQIASFSSIGPTPVSLLLKPDVSAPGVSITSSLPPNQGSQWGALEGTSMATPQVSGGVALLLQQHPGWTVAQIKSALVQTGDPVHGATQPEVTTTREGGGIIDLARATNPLLFAAPTALSFPVGGGSRAIELTDAGGGAGNWNVATTTQQPGRGLTVSATATVTVPGVLAVTAAPKASTPAGDYTGFVVLTRGSDTRRLPYWVEVSHPLLGGEPHTALGRPGVYTGTTAGGATRVSRYRYPTGSDHTYPGPESVYRVRITGRVANFGVAVTSGRAVPHLVYAGDEHHLVGYGGLPQMSNPYLKDYAQPRSIVAALLPLPGTYDVVFDTRSAAQAGPFTFRYWVNDTTPPSLHLLRGAPARTIWIAATDAGAGIDPSSVTATVDGHATRAVYAADRITVTLTPGTHRLVVTASDYEEAKNNENVASVTPNTRTLSTTVRVAG